MTLTRPFIFTATLATLLSACSDGSDLSQASASSQDNSLRMNQIQVLGSHNSYHIQPRSSILQILSSFDAELAISLEYSALPLEEQLDRGVRQLELDIFADPQGGMYSSRKGLIVIGEDPASGIPELNEPGLKVLHVQDIDFETRCLTFKDCLQRIKTWSDAHPQHVPISMIVEAKEEEIPDPLDLGFVVPLLFGPEEVNSIDNEILSIFPREQLITPDDVRGDHDTLESAVLSNGWPTLAQSRGKIMFSFLNRSEAKNLYIAGHPSLTGRVMFTNSNVGEPEAAWLNINNALDDFQEIYNLVAAGYYIRSRADEETLQAREDDYSLQEAAFQSGAQTISTDYVVPDVSFGTDYFTQIPGGRIARCNPVSAPAECNSELITGEYPPQPE